MNIEFLNVTKSFDEKRVLSDFSLKISEGRVCLFGESGCGKTTLLNLISGILKPDSGKINGIAKDTKISYVFQKPRLLPWVSCLENCLLAANGENARERAIEYFQTLEIAREMNKRPFELSGGMQQRVAIARALCFNGGILLLDEPFNGLDERICGITQELILKSAPKNLILVTHNLEHAKSICGEIIRLSGPPLKISERGVLGK